MRRESLWFFVTGSFTNLVSFQTAALINLLSAGALALRPFTVVRTRGFWHIKTDQTAAAEQQAANLGYAVVSDQASAIGVTAVPTPTTDQGSDLWQTYASLMTSQGAGQVDSNLGVGGEFDSRAMRKVEDGQDFVVVIETELAGLTLGCDVRHTGRVLIKLH